MNDFSLSWQFATVVVTVILSIIAGSMRFASTEQHVSALDLRVTALEVSSIPVQLKLDRISESLARIEGRMEEQRNQHTIERRDDFGDRHK